MPHSQPLPIGPPHPRGNGDDVLRVRTAQDLLAWIPYAIGFHPTDSLVVVCVGDAQPPAAGPMLRVDLPAHAECVDSGPTGTHIGIAGEVLWRLGHLAPGAVFLACYSDQDWEHSLLVKAMLEGLDAQGISVLGVGQVGSGHWRMLFCEEECCSSPGRPVSELAGSTASAAMVLAGRSVRPSRQSITADLDGDPEHRHRVAERIAALAARPVRTPAPDRDTSGSAPAGARARGPMPAGTWAMHIWRDLVRTEAPHAPAEVNDDQAAWVALAVRDVSVRDALLVEIVTGGALAEVVDAVVADENLCLDFAESVFDPVNRPTAAAHRAAGLLRQVARVCDPAAEPNVWALLAAVHWWLGDGAQCRDIAQRLLAASPQHSLGDLLLEVCDRGLAPAWAGAW
ncbi:MAG: hypothetical protein CSA58_08155 [Micrococcales bacterium]|nr:MAG: hypothetical protein CSA58_08155 [Micrococcales bacterium]